MNPPNRPDRRAVFLDRDGTLMVDTGYPKNPSEVQLLPKAVWALRRLREADFRLVVISNQSGVGRGLITPEEALAVHERFVACLSEQGIQLDGAYYCPHSPEAGCTCRKPAPGMLLRAAEELQLDVKASFVVGDKASDVEAGTRADVRGFLLHGAEEWDNILGEILSRRQA